MSRLKVLLVLAITLVLSACLLMSGCGCSELEQAQNQGNEATTSTLIGGGEGALVEGASTTDSTPSPTSQGATSTTLPPAATTISSTTTAGPWVFDPGLFQIQVDPGVVLLNPTRYEDDHPYLEWVGSWTTKSSSNYSGGSAKYTGSINSRVGIEFEGTRVQLIASTPSAVGKTTVHLYGSSNVDVLETIQPLGQGEDQVAVWDSGSLPLGQYTLYFGYDPTTTPGYIVWLDAIDVWGTVSAP